MKNYWCLGVIFCLLSTLAFAQKLPKDKKDKGRRLNMRDFKPDDTLSAVVENKIKFRNINKVPFYYDPIETALLNKYQKEKNWEELQPALADYVSKYGIENFSDENSMNILWQLGRTSESLGKMELVKEVYRLLIKHYRGDLRRAIRYYDSLSRFDKDLYVDLDRYYEMLELRKQIDTLQPPQGVLLNMGEEINSNFEEYGVTIARDDRTFLFTSRRSLDTENTPKALRKGLNEDIFFSKRIGDDSAYWNKSEAFQDINTAYNEGSPCISADGKILIFARCNSPEGLGDCDLYLSKREGLGYQWEMPKNLGLNMNTAFWDSHPSFSVTEDTLFFASDRKGGFGGIDIYFAVKDSLSQEWGNVQNMGPTINTQRHEVSPFLHYKHNVLYFSSNGQLTTFGGFDIYKTYWKKDTWTEPKNIGPLVNGGGDEFYFTIDSKSDKIYYAKSDSSSKNIDLFSFPMPMEAQPTAIVRFSGRVTEEKTGEVFEGEVHLIDLEDRIEIMPKKMREDGTFEFELMNNKKYMLIIQGENFFRLEEVFALNGEKELNLQAKKVIKSIKFESLEFDNGKADLKPEMENDLHLVINFLVDYPTYNLTISGHTDADGNPATNLKLSQQRADNIRKYIVAYGKIDPTRVAAIGKGSGEPIVTTEKTDADKRLNRRVEFRIFKSEEE